MLDRKWARIDITGQRFGKLIAVRWAPKTDRRTRWICKCDCGRITKVVLECLKAGHTKSCGCAWRERRRPKRDLAGKKFGKLSVLSFAGRLTNSTSGDSLWNCLCDCGKETVVKGYNLFSGASRSCGCAIRQALLAVNIKHGKTGTTEYRIWTGMLSRCYNKKEWVYKHYGKIGIYVCRRWRGNNGFVNFLADMGQRPSKGHSIERLKVGSSYSPKNCVWATRKEQANNKRNTVRVRWKGKNQALKLVCEQEGLKYDFILRRVKRGMSFNAAMTTPKRRSGETTVFQKAIKAGLKPPTVFARIRAGWTEQEALTTAVQ